MYCLHCGDCCKRMSPISHPAPCPNIREEGDFIFCNAYEKRPEQCINHTFPGYKFCPIGLDILGLEYPRDTNRIRIRIDEGWAKIKGENMLGDIIQ